MYPYHPDDPRRRQTSPPQRPTDRDPYHPDDPRRRQPGPPQRPTDRDPYHPDDPRRRQPGPPQRPTDRDPYHPDDPRRRQPGPPQRPTDRDPYHPDDPRRRQPGPPQRPTDRDPYHPDDPRRRQPGPPQRPTDRDPYHPDDPRRRQPRPPQRPTDRDPYHPDDPRRRQPGPPQRPTDRDPYHPDDPRRRQPRPPQMPTDRDPYHPDDPRRRQPGPPQRPTDDPRRRQTSPPQRPTGADSKFNIETYIFINPNLLRKSGASAKEFILNIMAETNQIYHHSSLTPNLNLVVRGFEEISESEVGLDTSPLTNCTPYLDTLIKYRNRIFKQKGVPVPDVAIYMTDRIMCDQGCIVLGCAYTGSICSDMSALVLCRSQEGASAILAHEMGHLLGMDHNEVESCQRYGGSPKDNLDIMSAVYKDSLKVDVVHWTACNVAQMGALFQQNRHLCLLDRPTVNLLDSFQRSRSRRSLYSANGQCELFYGRGWKYCKEMSNCSAIYCSPTPNHEDCITNGNGLADGTECGVNKACFNGTCIDKMPTVTGICGVRDDNHTYSLNLK